jgi:hypothetical protein
LSFEGKASSRSLEGSGCDEALNEEKKTALAFCGECRSYRQGCMPRTRDSEQAGYLLIAATGSGRSIGACGEHDGHGLARVKDLNSKLGIAKTALKAVAFVVNFIKSYGGPIKFVGTIASPIVKLLKENVEKAHRKLDPFVKKKIPPVKTRLEDAQQKNEEIKTQMETAHEAFHHYAYKVVLTADDRCPQTTKDTVCTNVTNRALQAVIDLVDRSAPALPNLNVFNGLVAFMNKFSSLIQGLSMGPLGIELNKIYLFLTARRCFKFITWDICFSIKDIFDNWVIRFVEGIIVGRS